jgi:hypothetical protein
MNQITEGENMTTKKQNIFNIFLLIIIISVYFSCVSLPSNGESSVGNSSIRNNRITWEEVERIDLSYSEIAFETVGALTSTSEDSKKMNDVFFEYLKDTHLIKITTELHLNENRDHQLIINRRWTGTEYVKFYIYQLIVVYRNCTIMYDFIFDNTRGAANYGMDNRFFNLYREDLDNFIRIVNSEMRILANQLSKSNDPLILGQEIGIRYWLNLGSAFFFF